MQHAHEILLFEAEVAELAPMGAPYDARDNAPGTALELLLYGSCGKYGAVARKFARARNLMSLQVLAASHVQAIMRGWLARRRAQMAKAATIVQAAYRRWLAYHGRSAKARRKRGMRRGRSRRG